MNKREFDAALRTLEPAALKALERSLKEGGAPALKAAELLLAYTQGRPVQEVSATLSFFDKIAGAALESSRNTSSNSSNSVTIIDHEPTAH